MAYNSAYTGSQVDAAVGAVRQKETIWDGKQDELTGTEDQLVGFNSAGEATAVSKPTAADVGAMPAVSGGTTGQVLTKTEAGQEWQDAPDGLPSGGEEGQVLTKTASGAQWGDVPSDLPAGGTDGQILTKTADGVAWENPPDTGVTTFNGRKGEVSPGADDYSASMIKFTDGQTFQQKYDSGQLTGPAGTNGTDGKDATINGVNALTLEVVEGAGIVGTQTGTTFKIDATELFQSVSDGKSAIAAAITDKGVETAADATFQEMAGNIEQIQGASTATVVLSGTANGSVKFVNSDSNVVQDIITDTTISVTIPSMLYVSYHPVRGGVDVSGQATKSGQFVCVYGNCSLSIY